MKKQIKKGFTIVELLIVIVVIGILASIVVVTYQGVQNKANTTAAEQNAREIINKAGAYNAVETVYPEFFELKLAKVGATDDAGNGGTRDVVEAKLGDKTKGLMGNTAPNGNSASDKSRIFYTVCTIDGANPGEKIRVGAVAQYFDYTENKAKTIRAGDTKDAGGKTNSCNAY